MRDSVPPRRRADAGRGAGWRGRGVLALVPITLRRAGGGAGWRGVLALVPITILAGTWSAGPSGGALPTAGAGAVRQLVTVAARSHNATYATLRAYWVLGGRRVPVFGPWTVRVGYNGVALPGAKREGDDKTPSGTFGISFFFGVQRKLDFSFPFRHAYSFDYWDDDPASPRYNEWVNANRHDPGVDPEPMHDVPAYDYAAVIAYNTARTPGLGSAIFLHVGFSSPTVGCVSLPRPRLITILLWLNPQDHPKITISG
ncbi:MAG TPA: L,D-transpeptidase family protein [Streptosporangiaceae bacterium]|nr:L,D-transpeptidase family protein [Streptosporangiaceae bacterium]